MTCPNCKINEYLEPVKFMTWTTYKDYPDKNDNLMELEVLIKCTCCNYEYIGIFKEQTRFKKDE